MRHAKLMFLEFLVFLTMMPVEQIGPIVGGVSGLALIVTLYDAFKGGPSQDNKNNRNLN